MDEVECGWYFERNREESDYWERSLALQAAMLEAQKAQNKIISSYGGFIVALLFWIYFQLGGSLLPQWLTKLWQ
jgi:hypothetical protein